MEQGKALSNISITRSGLKRDISFSRFNILTERNEDELIKQISDLTSIDRVAVVDLLEHTN